MHTLPSIHRERNGRVTCTVSFTDAETAASEEKALRTLGASVQVDGFRKGSVPSAVLKENIDPEKLFEETVRGLLPGTFASLTQEHGIASIIPPSVAITSNRPLAIKVIFVERPEVKLKGASKLSVRRKKPVVEEHDLQNMIAYILKQHQTSKVADRPARDGDRITMDFWGKGADGKEIAGIRTSGHQVIVGSKILLPGFEDALKGLKKGESKDFTLTFPEGHQTEALRGKPVTFHVIVKAVEEVTVPSLTDAFAREHLQSASAEAFKKQVEESMLKQEEMLQRRKTEEEAFEKIREATKVELVPELIADEKRSLSGELRHQLERQNMTLDDWMRRTGKKPEKVESDLEDQAQKRLRLRLGISALMQEKKIDVADEEMEQAIATLVSPLSADERLKIAPRYAKGEELYEQLKWQKKVEKLLDQIIGE